MLDSKKESDTIEAFDRIAASVKSLETTLANFSAKIEVLDSRYERLEGRIAEQDRLINKLHESTSIASSTVFSETTRLSSEIERFINERKRLSEGLLTKAVDGMSKELDARISKFEENSREFGSILERVESLGRDVLRTRSELEKFIQISEKIRSSDFDMKELVRRVEELSRQNNALKNRTDKLQRIIAQERSKKF